MSLLTRKLPSVLIIDDVPTNIQLLASALADFCDIRFALSGQEGLDLVAQSLPDLILLDVMMPGMDGYEVCDLLKHQGHTRDIPVMFVTAKNDPESETRALTGGAVDFIHKPINITVVRARVQTQLALRAQTHALQQLNQELEQRVEERTQALKEALHQAQAAQQAKSNFLANIGHEVRTPLNAIQGMSYLLARRVNDPELKAPLDKIRKAGERLLSLINGLIDLASLEAESCQVHTCDFDFLALLDSVEAGLQDSASRKGLLLYREIDPELPLQLHGDPQRLSQILRNLLDNAIKFSHQGCITLRARRLPASASKIQLCLEIEDKGIGIDPADQTRIFGLFEQGDASSSRRYEGTGLGLALVRHLVQLLGGELGVKSTPGQGSTFWVKIELGRAQDETHSASLAAPADPDQLRAMAQQLLQHLEESSLQALQLWEQHSTLLRPLLQDQATPFQSALEDFDLEIAAQLLQQALAQNTVPATGAHATPHTTAQADPA